MKLICFVLGLLFKTISFAQVTYPYPVHYFTVTVEQLPVKMAFMEVKPPKSNGESVILFHGKNFNGYYWKDVAAALTNSGYRVIIPDQVGWGRSEKPDIHYSFHMLADNSKRLLDSLGIQQVIVIGHSMGGMLATRFSLMYPDMVSQLILEDPIGLEDYRTFVPYTTTDSLFASEKKATYASYKKYQEGYYPEWKPEYEQYVKAQAEPLTEPNFEKTAWANALTYQMIYEQPVVYEFKSITVPTLLIVGKEDRTIVGKGKLSEEVKQRHGQYPELGKKTRDAIPNSELVELDGVGHIPHIHTPDEFIDLVMTFLKKQ